MVAVLMSASRSRHFTGVVASVYGDGRLLIAMYGAFCEAFEKGNAPNVG